GSSCTLPTRLVEISQVPPRSMPLGPQHYVSKAVASLPDVQAEGVDVYDGYAQPVKAIQFPYRPVDFGVDAQGNISVLLKRGGDDFEMRRFDANGKELAAWPVPVPMTINPASVAVAPDGTTAVLILRTVHFYAPDGKEIASWEHPWLVWESQLA